MEICYGNTQLDKTQLTTRETTTDNQLTWALQQYEQGKMHFNNQRYSEAKACWEIAGGAGCGKSYYKIAKLFEHGLGFNQNWKLALDYYVKATTLQLVEAHYYIGRLYHHGGFGVESDYSLAMANYVIAAEQANYPAAYHKIAYLFAHGLGVKKNESEALRFYRLAVEAGHIASNSNIGVIYCAQKRYAEALPYFILAANDGCIQAIFNIGLLYRDGLWVKKNLDLAMIHFQKAAREDYADPYYEMGRIYCLGLGIEPNALEAMKQFEQAAKIGHPVACFICGDYYFKQQSYEVALYYYNRSAQGGFSPSYQELAILFHYVVGDLAVALYWYRRSECAGNVDATEKINQLLMEQPSLQDTAATKKFNILWPLAEAGNATAQYQLGLMYKVGLYVKQSDSQAKIYFELSAVQGHPEATVECGGMYSNSSTEQMMCFQNLSNIGNSEATYQLAKLQADEKEMLDALSLAHMQGHQNAAFELYSWYQSRCAYNEKYRGLANQWLEEAVNMGHETAQQIKNEREMNNAVSNNLESNDMDRLGQLLNSLLNFGST